MRHEFVRSTELQQRDWKVNGPRLLKFIAHYGSWRSSDVDDRTKPAVVFGKSSGWIPPVLPQDG